MPYIVFKWQDNSLVEDGHRVYRSSEPMNPNALPAPIATVGANVEQYVDTTFTNESPLADKLYYRVSSYKGSINLVSDEVDIYNPANVLSPDSPAWLFANEEYGFANTLGLDTLFTDTSGTTPVVNYGDAIALAVNLADDGPDMEQATGAERLVWGRAPVVGGVISVRNELVGSDALSTQSVTVTAAQRTLSFRGTGTVTLSGASTAGPLVGTGADDIVSLTFTPTAGTLTLTVSGTVNDAQLELGASRSNYQSVGAGPYDIAEPGIPSVNIAYADPSDDNWSWNLAAGTYHVFIAGEKGCYFDTVVHAGGEFTVGPTTWTGGPEGAVTNLIGQRYVLLPVVLDRAFDDFEKAQLVAYAMARGCPGVWELGEVYNPNSEFDLTTGWNANGPGWTIAGNGVAVRTNAGVASDIISYPGALVIGDVYLQTLKTNSSTGGGVRLNWADPPGVGQGTGYAVGATIVGSVFTASAASTTFRCQSTNNFSGEIGYARVQKLTLNTNP